MSETEFDRAGQHYDKIAAQWENAKTIPYLEYIVSHSLFKMAGDVRGKDVLDLGCGEGTDTRRFKSLGAANVLGVDISAKQIQRAEEIEREAPLGCQYQVANVTDLDIDSAYDLVVGSFLLNNAASREHLLSLFRAIARALRPGGRFIGINVNMAMEPKYNDAMRKYGRWQIMPEDRKEGDTINIYHNNPDGSEMLINNYYLSPDTYASAAAEAGLRDFHWPGLSVSQAGIDAFPPGYWDDFFKIPQILGVEAWR